MSFLRFSFFKCIEEAATDFVLALSVKSLTDGPSIHIAARKTRLNACATWGYVAATMSNKGWREMCVRQDRRVLRELT